jgi:uncharacterized protein
VPPWAVYAALAVTGFVSSVINVVAGGGSFLTLPLLIFLGLPAVEANGTNRVGVVVQNVPAVWGFHRRGLLDWRYGLVMSLPSLVGALIGAQAALLVGDRAFRRVLAFVMVAVTLLSLLDPLRARRRGEAPPLGRGWIALGFFVVGLYGGFVQAGVGFLALAVTTLAGLDLVRGNALKVLNIFLATVLSLAVFAWDSQVRWDMGLALAAGCLAGGAAGVRLTVAKGHDWLHRVVTATVVLFAIALWLSG